MQNEFANLGMREPNKFIFPFFFRITKQKWITNSHLIILSLDP